ncbi:hypothetical protein DERF_015885 [Dermatophagoides farinae]|uniref:Uncharacterized protein n=1 Tax=Dermatophagoides farinae TaxID=6954 RepID=A0A922KVU6_DERFA|nr:hypothetical protein DERF_015885 [Dermatophagoides farinae]
MNIYKNVILADIKSNDDNLIDIGLLNNDGDDDDDDDGGDNVDVEEDGDDNGDDEFDDPLLLLLLAELKFLIVESDRDAVPVVFPAAFGNPFILVPLPQPLLLPLLLINIFCADKLIVL